MNFKGLLFFMMALAVSSLSVGQTEDFNGTIQKLQGSLVQVSSSSKKYDQEIKPGQFGSVRYGVDETDQKGAKISYAYEFNLADIDPYAVKQETQKDVIFVSLTVRNKQKLVKVYKNGETESYDEQLKIRTKDIDNARAIVDLVKKAIPSAEKLLAGKLKLKTYDEMVSWLVANTKNVELGSSKSIKQTLAKADYVGSLKLTEIETDAKGATEEQFMFNLADINLNSVNFKISGNKFAVNFETLQKIKGVSVNKAGKNSFVGEVSINTNNVDEARDIKTVLGMVVPLAVDKVKADNPKTGTTDEISAALKNLVKDVKASEKVMAQTVEPKCITTITQTTQASSSSEKNVYTFNWMDINPNITQIQVTGDKMFVEATALDKKPVIMHFKNDKLDGYENEVKFYTENIEAARRIKFVTEKAAEKCKSVYKDPFGTSANDAFSWLKKTVGEVVVEETSLKQTFDAAGEGFNKVKYTRISVKGNTSSEEIYEFNFSDINPTTVEVQVRGKWLYIRFESNFKAKIFGAYKDGKIQPYATTVEMAMKDVESARSVISAMKKCIENFKAK
ncbi:MAG TPA: hypothetical protein VFU05_13460 [Cyclobacteriaceae bacterium]|nr:hypothetical protein [Cyclobacteriaceae bacterium]